jgi:hypothetical protein
MNILLLSIVRYILCLKVNFSTSYLEILSWLDFFANKGWFTPRGRGQSYKIRAKSASVQFFAKIAKLLRNNDFCDQNDQIFCKLGTITPRGRGPILQSVKKIAFDRRFSLLFPENRDHNIDGPRLGEFSPIVWLFTLGSFFSWQHLLATFPHG